MRKSAKIWLAVGVIMIILGCVIFSGVAISTKGNYMAMFSGKLNSNEYEITESFSSISIDVETADIRLVYSEAEKCSLSVLEPKKVKHTAFISDGKLTVSYDDERKWYERIGIFCSPKITLTLPKTEYDSLNINATTGNITLPKDFSFNTIDISITTGNLNCSSSAVNSAVIEATTGNIKVENADFGSVEISLSTGNAHLSDINVEKNAAVKVTTGEVEIKNLNCKNFSSTGSTGDLNLTNVIGSESLYAKRSTGDVELDGIDAPVIEIQTTTGDIEGSILSPKTFTYSSTTGGVKVPQNGDGGECTLTTTTGDVKIRIK